MGRLQRYLRRLSPSEWEALHREACRSLGPKTVALVERLRKTGIPQVLSPSEKELAQRVERWIWRSARIEQELKRPLRASPPPEWILQGAELYWTHHLAEDALALLKKAPDSPFWALVFLFQRFKWEVSLGKFPRSQKTLGQFQNTLTRLLAETKRQRLQILLHRLLREQGGSYTASAKKLLQRLSQSTRWYKPLPTHPEEAYAELNLRGTYALAQGQLPEAIRLYESEPYPSPPPAILLNRWLCYLIADSPIQQIQHTLAQVPPHLSPHEKALTLSRFLLTLLLYAPPSFVESHRGLLQSWISRQTLYSAESRFLWAQLLWLIQRPIEAAQEIESLLKDKRSTFFLRFQSRILLPLLYAEAQKWEGLIRSLQQTLSFLQRARRLVASAPLLEKLARNLYYHRLRSYNLQAAAAEWRTFLAQYPTEAFFWRLTLLPTWIDAHLAGQAIHAYRAALPLSSVESLDNLLAQIIPLLVEGST